jgi:hypothetical protein
VDDVARRIFRRIEHDAQEALDKAEFLVIWQKKGLAR